MQRIADVMTRDVRCIAPKESVRCAAQLMEEMDVGILPVCEGDRLVGIVTDRDITVRATAMGKAPDQACVQEVMSDQVRSCFDDQNVDEVMQQMSDAQIRRIPVIDHDTHKMVGIVSLGDLATKHSAGVDHMLENISTPAHGKRH